MSASLTLVKEVSPLREWWGTTLTRRQLQPYLQALLWLNLNVDALLGESSSFGLIYTTS